MREKQASIEIRFYFDKKALICLVVVAGIINMVCFPDHGPRPDSNEPQLVTGALARRRGLEGSSCEPGDRSNLRVILLSATIINSSVPREPPT